MYECLFNRFNYCKYRNDFIIRKGNRRKKASGTLSGGLIKAVLNPSDIATTDFYFPL